jgi:threonine aldolase
MDALSAEFQFSVWKKIDENRTAVRFCTSWATQPEAVDALIAALQ